MYSWGYVSEKGEDLTLVLGGFDKSGKFVKVAAVAPVDDNEWLWKIAGSHASGTEAHKAAAMQRVECLLGDQVGKVGRSYDHN